MLRRFADADLVAKIKNEMANNIQNERAGGDPANIALAACDFDSTLAGKNLSEVLKAQGKPVTVPAAADLVVDLVTKGNCWGIFHAIDEGDLVRILKHPVTMVASDAAPGEPIFGRDVPHPRAYGTFARVLAFMCESSRCSHSKTPSGR